MMNYIVIDLEFNTKLNTKGKEVPFEIIEIAAVKIDLKSLCIIDKFSSLINTNNHLSKYIKCLTNIHEDKFKKAPSFEQVFMEFKRFIGNEYKIIAWGDTDLKMLLGDCEKHEVPCINTENWLDLQLLMYNAYPTTFQLKPGLKLAMNTLLLSPQGNEHNALDDALNTVSLFLKIHKKLDINKTYTRHPSLRIIWDGRPTNKAKNLFRKWIISQLEIRSAANNIKISWKRFQRTLVWRNMKRQHKLNNEQENILKTEFKEMIKILDVLYEKGQKTC